MRKLAGMIFGAACLASDVALAADLVEDAPAAVAATGEGAPELAALEWVRHEGPRVGQRVVAVNDGSLIQTIEWRLRNEVRVRSVSGAALTDTQRQAITNLALVCRQGEARDPVASLELNGTFVIEYDCLRSQAQ